MTVDFRAYNCLAKIKPEEISENDGGDLYDQNKKYIENTITFEPKDFLTGSAFKDYGHYRAVTPYTEVRVTTPEFTEWCAGVSAAVPPTSLAFEFAMRPSYDTSLSYVDSMIILSYLKAHAPEGGFQPESTNSRILAALQSVTPGGVLVMR